MNLTKKRLEKHLKETLNQIVEDFRLEKIEFNLGKKELISDIALLFNLYLGE